MTLSFMSLGGAGTHCASHRQRIRTLPRKRVVLIALPALMENLVRRACLADGEIDVERSIECIAELSADMMESVDVAIVGHRAGQSRSFVHAMLQRRAMLRVMLVELADADAVLWELLPEQIKLGPVSPAEIVRAVHDDVEHADGWALLTSGGGRGQ